MQKKIDRFTEAVKKRPLLAIGVPASVAVLAAIVIFAVVFNGRGLPETFDGEIDIKPAYASEYGVGVKQGFIITSDEPLTEALVKSALVLTPEFDYSMKKSDEGRTYIIEPKIPLDGNTVYQIGMDPSRALAGRAPRASNTWAFQTEADFKLLGAIPTDQGTEVPVNTALRFTFTQSVDPDTAGGYISMDPEIEGMWESNGKQLTLIPKKNLPLNTVFTVSVKSGLPNAAGDAALDSDVQFQFQTQLKEYSKDQVWFNIENDNNCFRTGEIPSFRYYRGWNEKPFENLDIVIYRFDDEIGYIEALRSRQTEYYWCWADREKILDTGALTKVGSFSVKDSKGFVLRCPESLSAGYYLADFKTEGLQRQSLFQVTDLSGYFAAGAEDHLVWLNDLRSGRPVGGARVTLDGMGRSAVTDESGVAILEGANERNPILSIVSAEGRLTMSGYTYSAGYEKPEINPYDYWYYLSTDRQIYRPGDTVNYFGIMAPRDGAGKQFTEAELILYGGAYSWGESAVRKKVAIEDGVISGSWELPNLKSDWYSIGLNIDGQSFGYTSFEVAFYEKPAYRFALSCDKRAVFAGDKLTWSIAAGYFEGTPVAGLDIYTRFNGNEKRITTGSEGETEIVCTAPAHDSKYLTAGSYMWTSAVLPELGDVSAYGSVTVFNSDIDVEGSVKRDKRVFNLRLNGYDVDLSRVNNEDAPIWRSEYRRDLTGSTELKADLIRIEYDKITNGPFYNEYTLQTYYTYDYNRRDIHENSFGMTLTNEGLDFEGELESGNSYEIVITGNDHKGRQFTRTYYIPEERRSNATYEIPDEDNFWENFDWGNYYRYFYIEEINSGGYSFAVGDELKFALRYRDVRIPKPDNGNILYFRSQETIRDYALSEDGVYEMRFEERDIPNVNLMAVCFDGKYYVESDMRYVSLDPADKAARVKITTDKKRYAPGETVKMHISMTDNKGKPLQGSVNISLVDEALFAVSENYQDIGYTVFSNKYSFAYSGSASHLPVDTSPGGAEMGEGGGEREDFRDTAFFETIKTDSKGEAELSFELPDNITSWRITWQGYSAGIYVGTGSQNIEASLDFFLDYRLARVFLKGDEPKIGLRSAGRGIDALKSNSTYSVEIPSMKYTGAANGKANTWQELALPELSSGTHKVKIGAENGEYKDAVNMEFSVVESFAGYRHEDEIKLTEQSRPAGSKIWPTTLIFCDKSYSGALNSLYSLAWRDGVRLEQKLVSRIASEILAEDMGIEYYALGEDEELAARHEIIKYQQGNGGIAPFVYSEADIETSALAASIGSGYFDRDALASYFYDYFEYDGDEIREKTLALWGLAALKEPVLVEIQKRLEAEDLSGEDKLNLTMALFFAGGGAQAKVLAKELIPDFTEDLGAEVRSKIDMGDKADQTKATARLALLASVFDLPQSEGLLRYMENNTYEGDYYLLEKIGIAQNNLSRLPEDDAVFTYTLDGKTKTINLRSEIVYSLFLLPEHLDEIRFSGVSGDVAVTSCYMKEGQPPDGSAAIGQLTLKKTVNGSGEASVTVPQGNPVRMRIDFWIAADAPNGCYTITDMLPAGLRFGYVEGYRYWYAKVSGNENKEVEFSVYKTDYSKWQWKPDYYQPDGSLKATIYYVAYPAMTGSFTSEAPRFGHSVNDNIMIHAPESRITIE